MTDLSVKSEYRCLLLTAIAFAFAYSVAFLLFQCVENTIEESHGLLREIEAEIRSYFHRSGLVHGTQSGCSSKKIYFDKQRLHYKLFIANYFPRTQSRQVFASSSYPVFGGYR